MGKDELDSDVTTLVTGLFVPSETLVPIGEESLDQTPGPSGEQETKEMPETADDEPDFKMIFYLSQVIKTTED